MELETITVIMAIAGAVLLYGAVKNKNPIEVIKLTIQGKNPADAAALSTASAGGGLTQTIPGTATAAPGLMHDNGKGARFFPNNTPRYIDDPLANDLPAGDPRKKLKSGTTDPNGFVLAAKNATRAQGGYQTNSDSFGNGGIAHEGIYPG